MTSRPETLHSPQQINDGRRDDRVNWSQPTGYISEEIISPVSLLRSDRFLRNGLIASPPDPGQLRELTAIRPATASFTEANNRTRYRREQQRLLSDVNDTMQQSRPCTAPQTIMSKAKSSDMIQDATNMPASRSRSYGSKDKHTVDRGQASENFGTRIKHPELGETRMTDGAFKEDQDSSGQTRGVSTSRKLCVDRAQPSENSGIQNKRPQVEKASMMHEDVTTDKDGSAETKGISRVVHPKTGPKATNYQTPA
ncbi:hypothetical protein R1sor_021011 [Riccia sorocarpa]|uniref:Uncharacterized protein n=1 Tax=Riccia sorocarpa TaxID=122646 RepID=A0ABD3GJ66_9MARC